MIQIKSLNEAVDIGPSSWPPIETPKALRLGPCSEVEAAAAELNLKLVGGDGEDVVGLRSWFHCGPMYTRLDWHWTVCVRVLVSGILE